MTHRYCQFICIRLHSFIAYLTRVYVTQGVRCFCLDLRHNHTRWAKYYHYLADVLPAGTIILKPGL
jgi:hypothetical protein